MGELIVTLAIVLLVGTCLAFMAGVPWIIVIWGVELGLVILLGMVIVDDEIKGKGEK